MPRPSRKRRRSKQSAEMAKISKTYRVAPDVVEYLEAQGDRAETLTVEEAVRLLRDVRSGLGAEIFEIEKRAKVAGVPVGQVLAELALAGLKRRRP